MKNLLIKRVNELEKKSGKFSYPKEKSKEKREKEKEKNLEKKEAPKVHKGAQLCSKAKDANPGERSHSGTQAFNG